ncbi:MAG: LLM class flavin-dependent oxidoreductase [Chloroflexota bacterium]
MLRPDLPHQHRRRDAGANAHVRRDRPLKLEFHLGYSSRAVKDYSLERRQGLVRLAEELGFDGLWHSGERFYRDQWVNLTMSAMLTNRIKLGTAIADPYSIHPALTAMSLATADEVSGGRAILGIGAGGSGFPPLGIERRKPARAIREAIEVMRQFLSGERVDYAGEIVQLRGAELHIHARPDIPMWVATRGDAVLRMAGEVADGVIVATYATPRGVSHALSQIEAGARKSGRKLENLAVMSRVDTCVLPDGPQAREGIKQMIAFLLWSSYPDKGFVEQSGLTIPTELEALLAKREYDLMHGAGHLVPDEFVDAFAWAGTVEEVAQRVAAIARLGISRFGFWLQVPPGGDMEAMTRTVAIDVQKRAEELIS